MDRYTPTGLRCGDRRTRIFCIVGVGLGVLAGASWQAMGEGDAPMTKPLTIVAPEDGETLPDFLTATLAWTCAEGVPFTGVKAEVAADEGFTRLVASVRLSRTETELRLALVPQTRYFWKLTPQDDQGERPQEAVVSSFVTGQPRIEVGATDAVRYRNPRAGAHWQGMEILAFAAAEPLAPWYSVKHYQMPAPPTFEAIKDKLPIPVLDGRSDAVEAYWYCWKTLLTVWTYAPTSPDHQAVANLEGIRSWGPWGSTMVWDSAFMQQFARFGHQVYPFITAFDNCYARQHENGFICRESDKDNREVYVIYPLNPPLFAWAEWEYYQVSGDRERLAQALLPIVKHYEWWMVYQRRENGLYWTDGFNEADDSPRNPLMYYSVSANSYQALAARYLARMADVLGRKDLQAFFEAEWKLLGETVNRYFWDEKHKIYNDLNRNMEFITEQEPGRFCKTGHMFWPLLAEIAPPDRVAGMASEVMNTNTFNRLTGIACLSADSAGYREDGQYWHGAVWPPIQWLVQRGLDLSGRRELAEELAEKYMNAVVSVFKAETTIKENLWPDKLRGHGAAEFVGWGGIGPVADLIQYVLGFEISVPENTVGWHIRRTERHGIRNLKLGDFYVDLICAARRDAKAPCRITVNSGGTFTLKIFANGPVVAREMAKGQSEFEVK